MIIDIRTQLMESLRCFGDTNFWLWNNGKVERWNSGLLKDHFLFSFIVMLNLRISSNCNCSRLIIPKFQYSNIPVE
jgi:hypothetical protein